MKPKFSRLFVFVLFASSMCGTVPSQPLTFDLIGQISAPGSGTARCLAIRDNLAYQGGGGALSVFDISNPTNPILLNTRSLIANWWSEMDIDGDRLYLSIEDFGISIFDISNPSPVLISRIGAGGGPNGVVARGQLIFVAVGYAGFAIVDVLFPSHPLTVFTFNTQGNATDVAIEENYAYVTDGLAGLLIFDISDPANSRVVGSVATHGFANRIAVSGSYAYIANKENLSIVDVTNPARPTVVGTYDTPVNAFNVAVSGSLAYVADLNSGMIILDVSNPATPILVDSQHPPEGAFEIHLLGNHAYVASGRKGIQIFDVSDPASIEPEPYNFLLNVSDVAVDSGFAYTIGTQSSRLQITDATNPSNPQTRAFAVGPALPVSINVQSDYAYLTYGYSGIRIFNVSNPDSPSQVGGLDMPGAALKLKLKDSLAFVAYREEGLRIIDVSQPDSPVPLGHYNTPGLALSVDVAGNYAYVADEVWGLQILDISDPSQPVHRANYRTLGSSAVEVAVGGHLVYLAVGWEVQIIDVINPSSPRLLGSVAFSASVTKLQLVDSLLFARVGSGFHVLDVSNPTTPVLRGSFNGAFHTVADGLVYSDSLKILRINQNQPDPNVLNYTENGGDTHNWFGGAVGGFGGESSSGVLGLCMYVPEAGDNFVLWASPEALIELRDGFVYRSQITASSDQANTDAIPLFFLNSDNFQSSGGGNNFGGSYWILDVDGGSQGISRPQGRTAFDFYIAPTAINAPQWINQAFTPAADAENDMRLQYRVIDANEALLTQNDSGTICVSRLEVTAIPHSSLVIDQTVLNAPISSTTHFGEALDEVGVGGSAMIEDANTRARYQLATSGGDARKTLGFYNASAGSNLNTQLYPVIWDADTLYRTRLRVRAESAINDPVDAIYVAMDTTNLELGMSAYTNRGAPGGPMDGAGSPRLEPAEYESYFYSHNATLSTTPDANRLRPLGIFFNTGTIAGDGTGGDAFFVEGLAVDRLVTP